MVLVVHTVPIIRCLLDLMTLRQWFQKLRMNGQKRIIRYSLMRSMQSREKMCGGIVRNVAMNGSQSSMPEQKELFVRYVPKEKCLQDIMIWRQRIKIYSVTGIMNRTEYSRQKYHELLLNGHGGNADTDIHGV